MEQHKDASAPGSGAGFKLRARSLFMRGSKGDGAGLRIEGI